MLNITAYHFLFSLCLSQSLGINANPQDLFIMSLWQPTSKENLVVIAATTYPLYSWILKIENSKLLKLDRLDSNRLLIQVQDEIAAVGLVDGHLNLNIYDVEEKEISEKLSSSLRWPDTVGPPKHVSHSSNSLACMHTQYIHACMYTQYTHACTHTHTHPHMRTCAHTHTHTLSTKH